MELKYEVGDVVITTKDKDMTGCEVFPAGTKCVVVGTREESITATYSLRKEYGSDDIFYYSEDMMIPFNGDAVKHPNHYKIGKYECIDEMISLFGVEAVKNFCICNVFKYRYRASKKNGEEDIRKAGEYMDILKGLENESRSYEKKTEM